MVGWHADLDSIRHMILSRLEEVFKKQFLGLLCKLLLKYLLHDSVDCASANQHAAKKS